MHLNSQNVSFYSRQSYQRENKEYADPGKHYVTGVFLCEKILENTQKIYDIK